MKRVIKKYPNRRLYDTEESRYITLSDVRELVVDGVPLLIVDKESNEDITRAILLQIINEQEQRADSIMSEAFLIQMIRAYGVAAPGFLARHLEKSLTSFLTQQTRLLEPVKQAVGESLRPVVDGGQKRAG